MATGTKTLLDYASAEFDHRTIENDGVTAFVHGVAKADGTVVDPATEAKQDALLTVIGVVGASPASNTVMDRLKAIVTGLGAVVLGAGSAVIGKVDHTTTGIAHGSKSVTTAGTDEALVGSSTPAKWVEIQARTNNTGWVAIGAAGVDATVGSGSGVLLSAGESRTYPCDNLADIYIDATTSGEGVRFTYGT